MVGHVHDDAHVVFDDQQGNAELAVGALQAINEAIDECRVDPSGGLVEQQYVGLVHERHRELEQLLLSERQTSGPQSPLLIEAHKLQEPLGPSLIGARVLAEHIPYAALR